MSNDTLINNEVIQKFKERVVLTEGELLRTFTQDELKLLCEKYKCKVDMWKWNPVDDMREKLEKDGRFKNRTANYCLRLIAKGVNKHKSRIVYNREDIEEVREEDWNIQKRACIRFLRECKNRSDQQINRFIESKNGNNMKHCHNISSNSSVEEDSNRNSQNMVEEHLFDSVSDYTVGDTEVLLQTNETFQNEGQQIENDIQNTVISSSNPEVLTQLNSQDIQNVDVNSELCRNLDCNTQSMTLGTEDIVNVPDIHVNKGLHDFLNYNTDELSADTNSQAEENGLIQSEDILSVDYAHFGKQIPLTSTQSQE